MTRDLVFTGFEGDDGSADAELAAALAGEGLVPSPANLVLTSIPPEV